MSQFPPIPLPWRGRKLIGKITFALLLLASIGLGVGAGLLFVYGSDLPEIHALENYRPDVVTELYADDGQLIGSFALQRRILITYDQIPKTLHDAVLAAEDQHFDDHWGVDFPRALQAAWRNLVHRRITEGASTLTMQLAGRLFLDRTDRSFRRKIQETLLAIQVERHYSKQQIFTMYANQVYLARGNYGFEAAAEYYFGKPVTKLTLPEAATIAAMLRGPSYSPVLHSDRALARRNWVLGRMATEGKVSQREADAAIQTPLVLHLTQPRNDLAPYFFEEIRKYLEHTYGTEAVHQQGLRVYTTLNVAMQRAANQAVADGLHEYDRRHGWRGKLPNILRDKLGTLEDYDDEDWHHPIEKGHYVIGLVLAVDDKAATIRVGPYLAGVQPADYAWTGHKTAAEFLKPGDLTEFLIKDLSTTTAKVELEQKPLPQGALVAIDNATGGIRAMVGGYSFDESKFNRATQALRQVGSSFKPYVYATAIEEGFSPFDTILDAPYTTVSGGQAYSPHNYDEKFEGTITLRRALAGSRNVPAIKLAEKIGMTNVVDTARRFGITSPLPPYLPVALGAAEITLLEHTSAFTVFPDEGIRIEPQMIRRVTSYDGAVLEEARPAVHDVLTPDVAHTMTAMLEEVVRFGTAVHAKELGRPCAGKTGTTNDFTDAWFIGFTPSLTAGVWVGYDDKQISLGHKESGARAALPLWLEFMKMALDGKPVEDFANVESLEKQAQTREVKVDTPDSAPTEDDAPGGQEGVGPPRRVGPAPKTLPKAPGKTGDTPTKPTGL
jgi:penicillin-binding protein 1A